MDTQGEHLMMMEAEVHDASTSQGMPMTANQTETEGEAWGSVSVSAFKGTRPADPLIMNF